MKVKFLLMSALTAGLFLSACNEASKTSTETSMDSSKMDDHKMDEMKDHSSDLMAPMTSMMATMKDMKMTGDFDYDFANMMISHHQAAIEMAQVEVQKGTDAALKTMAQGMIAAQESEIAAFRDILKDYKVPPTNTKEAHAHGEMTETMDKMMKQMGESKMTGNVDKDFAMMMIPHHEAAVTMSGDELSHGKNLALKKMAQKILEDQTKEIADLKTWLAGK